MLNKDHMPDDQNSFQKLEDRGWSAMAHILDREMPLHKRRRGWILWWGMAAALLVGFVLYELAGHYQTNQSTQEVLAQRALPTPAIQAEEPSSTDERTANKIASAPKIELAESPNINQPAKTNKKISPPSQGQKKLVPTFANNFVSYPALSPNTPDQSIPETDIINTPEIMDAATTLTEKKRTPLIAEFLPPVILSIVAPPSDLRNVAPILAPFSQPAAIEVLYHPWSLSLNTLVGARVNQKVNTDLIIRPFVHTYGLNLLLNRSIGNHWEISAGIGYQRWIYKLVLFRLAAKPELILGADALDTYSRNVINQPNPASTGIQASLHYLSLPLGLKYRLSSRYFVEGNLQPLIKTNALAFKEQSTLTVTVDNAGQPVLDKQSGFINNQAGAAIPSPIYKNTLIAWYVGAGIRVTPFELGLRWYNSPTFFHAGLVNQKHYRHQSIALSASYRLPFKKKISD